MMLDLVLIIAICSFGGFVLYKVVMARYEEIERNNQAAIKWAKKMEKEHNVHVALYEDESGKIVDYVIYKL